jgi:hypothetical protein
MATGSKADMAVESWMSVNTNTTSLSVKMFTALPSMVDGPVPPPGHRPIQRTFREHSGNFQGEYSGKIEGTFRLS